MTSHTQNSGGTLHRIKTFIPRVIVLAIFATAVWFIGGLLDEIDVDQVIYLIRGTPVHIILFSLLCMLGSYFAMTGYDWSALRYIGETLPLRVSMAGAFLGFAIAANIGTGPVAGGAVRYRIYAPYGLSVTQVATIAIFGSIAFGLGITVIGTAALVVNPGALSVMTPLSPALIRWIAAAALLTCAGSIGALALFQGKITLRKVTIRAPSLGLVGAQLVFTAVDFLLAATTLYLLLPPSDIGILPFLAVFTVAVTAGVVSHVPGGVGVFEMVILAALPTTISLETAAAGLLLFRVIYYFTPFLLALMSLAALEIIRMRRRI